MYPVTWKVGWQKVYPCGLNNVSVLKLPKWAWKTPEDGKM